MAAAPRAAHSLTTSPSHSFPAQMQFGSQSATDNPMLSLLVAPELPRFARLIPSSGSSRRDPVIHKGAPQ